VRFTHEWQATAPKVPHAALAEVVEALLPLHQFNAPVIKVVRDRLSVVERFIIEAALDLGSIAAIDVAEVTGLQPDLAARVIARVAAVGVLEPDEDAEAFRPVTPAAANALTDAELRQYHHAELTFLYLPRTDDLIAFEPGSGKTRPPLLNRVAPVYQAPLPAELVGAKTAEFLEARIAAGTLLGLPDWLHGPEPSAERLPETCPAYRCRGHLRGGGKGPVLRLVDATRTDRVQPFASAGEATGLTAWLSVQAESLTGAFAQWDEPVLSPHRLDGDDDTAYGCDVPGDLARKMMTDGLPLSRPLGLAIHDEEARLRIGVRLRPADLPSRELFALDQAVAAVLAVPLRSLDADRLSAAVSAAGAAYDCELVAGQVRDELWRRRQFFHVYQLRAADDFAYD
jgi:hypothetical protein